jgi:predicted kinase
MTNKPTLHLICGQAGAGKTTYAKQLEIEDRAIRFTKDEWIISLYGRDLTLEQWSQYEPRCYACIDLMAKPILQRGLSVIMDYGFWYRQERARGASLAIESGADCIIHFLNISTELRRERVLNRNKTITDNSIIMSEKDFDMQISWFETPTEQEGITIRRVEADRILPII